MDSTLWGAVVGAAIAGIVAVGVTWLNNGHASKMAADEREAQEKARRRTAGLQSAKDALEHLNRIRGVFASFMEDGEPEQDWYESAYQQALLAVVNIDDDWTARTLTDIAEVYWSAWMATEEGEWNSRTLSYRIYKLAQATVRAYVMDGPKPDRSELDQMLKSIEASAERREEQEREWREELRREREAKRVERERLKAAQQEAEADAAPE